MVNSQLLKWIQEQINRGIPLKQVKAYLIQKGYTPLVVQEASSSFRISPQSVQPQRANQPVKPRKAILFTIIGIMAILSVTVYFFLSNSEEKIVTIREFDETREVQADGIDLNVRIKAEVKETVNCGDPDCFDQKFVVCEPATLDFDMGFVATHYEILEPSDGGCKTIMRYTKNPNPEWLNKDMTCIFDNSKNINNAVEDILDRLINNGIASCEGPLAEVLRSLY